jgi:hypothetical protein
VGVSAGVSEEMGSVGAGIREIGYAHFDDSDVWATKTNRFADDGTFYVYAADTNRMLDIFHVDPHGDAPPEAEWAGTWLTPEEALEAKEQMEGALDGDVATYCLLR